MNKLEPPLASRTSTRKGIYLTIGLWSLVFLFLGALNYRQLTTFTKTTAISQARSQLQKDITFRKWVASQGGVYVPAGKETPPNPYLSHLPHRDINLADTSQLTLLNPAYLIRLIIAEHEQLYGVTGKITSLKPINADNSADSWEREALKSFAAGEEEAISFTEINGIPHLRYMLPLVTRESCLKCHARQGYTVGDIRGGLTVSLPMTAMLNHQSNTFQQQTMLLVGIWLVGILFILLTGKKIVQQQVQNQERTNEVRASNNQLQKRLTELDAITASVHDIMYMFDKEGRLHWWNKSLETLSRVNPTDFATTHVLDFIIEEDRAKIEKAIDQVLVEDHVVVEGKIDTMKGVRHFQFTGAKMVLDNTPYIVGIGRDLNEQRQTEKMLLQARKNAESANRAKSAFLSNMSHELRTPLNAILGYAQIFASDTDLSIRHKRGLKTIQESGEHLLMLINDILDLSKVEAGKMKLVPSEVDLEEFFNGVVDIIQIRATEKGLSFRYEFGTGLPQSIITDELRLRQVLFNLLSNAIKFTDKGYCGLFVESVSQTQTRVTLSFRVEDSGVGIAPEMKEKIFQPFQQSGDPVKFAEGSGLGLAISKKIITLMGGEFGVSSSLDKGSSFYFSITVPIAKQQTVARLSIRQQQTDAEKEWHGPVPDTETIEQILTAIKGGDIDTVIQLIEGLREQESGKYKAFVEEMATMADDFKLGEMETFLEKFDDTATKE